MFSLKTKSLNSIDGNLVPISLQSIKYSYIFFSCTKDSQYRCTKDSKSRHCKMHVVSAHSAMEGVKQFSIGMNGPEARGLS